MKRVRRALWMAVVIVVAFGVAAPYLRTNRLRPRIEAALQMALNRPVHVGSVRLNLFTGPGFTVKDVIIEDDPAAGIEPFAHVESIEARVSFLSLFAGQLAFSSVRLSNPSVNLVKTQSGPWNIQPLLDRALSARSGRHRPVPDLEIRSGRLNFKFSDTKSIFFIEDADVDIYPNANGELVVRFSGAPARTDRSAHDFGLLSARGLLRSNGNGGEQLSMGIHLERTAISEIVKLFNGRDIGVHGTVLANASLAGPLSALEVSGDLNIKDIHRWDLMPATGEGWTLRYRGSLDLVGHRLNLETAAMEGQQAAPVMFKLRLADYLAAAPKWAVGFLFRDVPAASLLETARHMGAPLPADVRVEGAINGGIGYSPETGLEGQLAVAKASLTFPASEAINFESAHVLLSKNAIALAPAAVRLANGQSAQIQGEYALDASYATLRIDTRQLTIAEVQSSARELLQPVPIPLLDHLRRGTWKGWIAFARFGDRPGIWTGEYDLQNALMDLDGLASPLRFASASVDMKAGQLRMNHIHGRAGTVTFDGDYRYDPDATPPNRLHVRIAKLQLSDFEHLMRPTLLRNEGFLARTFRFKTDTAPPWLAERQLDASVDIGQLAFQDVDLGKLQAHVAWDGPSIEISDMQATAATMHAAGTMTVSLAKSVPSYRLSGSIENLEYRNGTLDLGGELTTSGAGQDLLLNLHSLGTFQGQEISLGPDTQMAAMSGTFRIMPGLGAPRLLLSNLEVTQGEETLSGQGAVQADGRVILDLVNSGRKPVRLTGSLLPLHTDPVPAVR